MFFFYFTIIQHFVAMKDEAGSGSTQSLANKKMLSSCLKGA